jgi:hypothetical protein
LKILLCGKDDLFVKGPAALIIEEALSTESEGSMLLA